MTELTTTDVERIADARATAQLAAFAVLLETALARPDDAQRRIARLNAETEFVEAISVAIAGVQQTLAAQHDEIAKLRDRVVMLEQRLEATAPRH